MQQRASKSGLFLMELIMVIMFFSITSAITANIFVKSHSISQDTIALTHANIETENIAEIFRAKNGDIHQTLWFFPLYEECSDSSYVLYYDEDWNKTSVKADAGYFLKIDYTEIENIRSIHCTMYSVKSNSEILAITVDKYIGFQSNELEKL